jgi:hypothetical protein
MGSWVEGEMKGAEQGRCSSGRCYRNKVEDRGVNREVHVLTFLESNDVSVFIK